MITCRRRRFRPCLAVTPGIIPGGPGGDRHDGRVAEGVGVASRQNAGAVVVVIQDRAGLDIDVSEEAAVPQAVADVPRSRADLGHGGAGAARHLLLTFVVNQLLPVSIVAPLAPTWMFVANSDGELLVGMPEPMWPVICKVPPLSTSSCVGIEA